jgi:serine/threonine-protein kinase
MWQGRTLDRKYELLRLLGQGGMGAVYEARHLGTGRRVAVKVIASEALQQSPDILARFKREARASGVVESQYVVQVLDSGVDPETRSPYMVMEFLTGEDLHQLLQRAAPIAPEVALRVAAQACIGLQKAHDAGVVHRDIKSANLFLARLDAGDVVIKVLDFGIAKVKVDPLAAQEGHGLTRTGSLLGSPFYMSPEQAKGSRDVDHRTDIWSLGIVLYEALTGVTPHGTCTTLGTLILAICSEPPRPVQEGAPWVPLAVAAIVDRALALDPAARFPSVVAMGDAIRALLPQGIHLTDAILAAPSARQGAQPTPQTPASSGPNASRPSTGGTAPAVTNNGLARPGARASGGVVWALPLALASVLAIGGGGFLGYRALAKKAAEARRSPPPITSGSGATDAAHPPPAGSTANDPPVEPPHAVPLRVSPPAASVEIDGSPVPVSSGVVTLQGALDSTHSVRVSMGRRETSVDVAITSSGAVPAHIDLPAASSGRPGNPGTSPIHRNDAIE